jgi:myo-inositol-1(or 4)-monophosphatase
VDFPVLVANRQETLERFKPWAEALETKQPSTQVV